MKASRAAYADAVHYHSEVVGRPEEIGESFIWVKLADGYMPLRLFIVNGEPSKWQNAENWERNPWFP